MARIRSVKPDICTSETLAGLPAEVERTFVRLWTHLDDEGRCVDHPKLIKAALFPLHDEVTAEVVDAHLSALATAGCILRYGVEGKRYIACPSWSNHQHPQKARDSILPAPPDSPLPDGDDRGTRPVAETYGPVVGEVDVEGEVAVSPETGLTLIKPKYSAEFEAWWALYPRKVEKEPASKAYATARRSTSAQALLDALAAHAAAWEANGKELKFILYPERWLKRKLYAEPPPPIEAKAGRSATNRDRIRKRAAVYGGAS